MVAHYNQFKKADGIVCDVCGAVCINKFKYYSAKFDLVEVDSSIGKSGPVNVERRMMDLDYCVDCMEKLKAVVMSVIEKKNKGGDSWTAKTQ